MTVGTLKLGRREFVVIPKREYLRLSARLAEDARDVRLAKAALAEYRKTGRGISLDALQRELRRR